MRRPPPAAPPSDASWRPPFQFTAATRSALVRLLRRQIVHVEVVVCLLEAQTNAYLLVRPSQEDPPPHIQLDALRKAARELTSRLSSLGDDATGLLIDALSRRGYDARFAIKLREGLQHLDEAIDQANDDEMIPRTQSGRPPELTRRWFDREVCRTLTRDGGMDVSERAGARTLSQCLRLLLEAAGEPVPADMRPLLNEARQP